MASNRMLDRMKQVRKTPAHSSITGPNQNSPEYEEGKRRFHNELLDSLDFEEVSNTPRDELQERMRESLSERVERAQLPLSRPERERMIQEILDNVLGLGPIEP